MSNPKMRCPQCSGETWQAKQSPPQNGDPLVCARFGHKTTVEKLAAGIMSGVLKKALVGSKYITLK